MKEVGSRASDTFGKTLKLREDRTIKRKAQFSMSVQGQRFPLGEFSNSRVNRMSLLSSGNNNTLNRPVTDNNLANLVHGEGENDKPFIKKEENVFHSASFPISGNTSNNHNYDMLLNESPTNRILNAIISRRKFNETIYSNRTLQNPNKTNSTSSNVLQFSETASRDYSEVSKKLQVRLQFAYYKLQTKQIDMKFAELKNKMNSKKINASTIKKVNKRSTSTSSKQPTKRRKLLVSQGNYKTPAKNKNHPKILIEQVGSADTMISTPSTMVDTTSNHSPLETNQNGIMVPTNEDNNETTTAHNNTTLLNHSITPIHDSIKHLSTSGKEESSSNPVKFQQTPMSIKAAKSLIELFSSIKHSD